MVQLVRLHKSIYLQLWFSIEHFYSRLSLTVYPLVVIYIYIGAEVPYYCDYSCHVCQVSHKLTLNNNEINTGLEGGEIAPPCLSNTKKSAAWTGLSDARLSKFDFPL